MYDGSTNGRGENRQKFLKEMMNLAPMVHASGILENRAAARKRGFQNVEDAVNKRLNLVAKREEQHKRIVDGWLYVRLYGGEGVTEKGVTETFPRLLPKWAEKRIQAGKRWPLFILGYRVIVEQGTHEEGFATTTAAIYRFRRMVYGQRFIWGEDA